MWLSRLREGDRESGLACAFCRQGQEAQEQGDASGGESADGILPPFVVGESGPHTPSATKSRLSHRNCIPKVRFSAPWSRPERRLTTRTLREAMKENGIGRPSTRSHYRDSVQAALYRPQGKSITALPAGIELIATINEELLKSAKLTGLWENKLRRIERGEFSAAEFIAELKGTNGADCTQCVERQLHAAH